MKTLQMVVAQLNSNPKCKCQVVTLKSSESFISFFVLMYRDLDIDSPPCERASLAH